MKDYFKKYYKMGFLALLLAGIMVGCGSNNGAPGTTGTTAGAMAVAAGPVSLGTATTFAVLEALPG